MNPLLDGYQEHERQAELAATRRDYPAAVEHLKKSAAFALELAKRTDGALRERYVRDANQKLEIAEGLKARARSSTPSSPAKSGASPAANRPGNTKPAAEKAQADGNESFADSFIVSDRPDVTLADVVGMEDLKRKIDTIVVKPYQYREKYAKAGLDGGDGGILLYGPPGTGKTHIARALAGELDVTFFNVDPSRLVDKFIGETPKRIAELFERVREHPRAIVFIDEVTQLAGENETIERTGAIEQLFRETDGMQRQSKGFLLLMATNYPWKLPAPLLRPGRTRDAIFVGLPDQPARLAMLQYHLRQFVAQDRLTADVDLPNISAMLEGRSAAELASVARRAKERVLLREISQGLEDQPMTAEDLFQAASEVRPTTNPADLQRYLDWGASSLGSK